MRLLPATLLSLCLAAPLLAQAPAQDDYKLSTAAVRKDVVALISEQLVHFREGEPAKAYALAAARFRAQCPLDRFVAIVKQSYPEIWANTGAQFGVVRDDGISAVVVVQVDAKDGAQSAYDYFLLREGEQWRIGGAIRHVDRMPRA